MNIAHLTFHVNIFNIIIVNINELSKNIKYSNCMLLLYQFLIK